MKNKETNKRSPTIPELIFVPAGSKHTTHDASNIGGQTSSHVNLSGNSISGGHSASWAFTEASHLTGRPYRLPDNINYFSVQQIQTGNLEDNNKKLESSNRLQKAKLDHLHHPAIDKSVYLIWKFVPVGLGRTFTEDEKDQASAEWEMKYQPNEPLRLSPHFSGKRRFFLVTKVCQ